MNRQKKNILKQYVISTGVYILASFGKSNLVTMATEAAVLKVKRGT